MTSHPGAPSPPRVTRRVTLPNGHGRPDGTRHLQRVDPSDVQERVNGERSIRFAPDELQRARERLSVGDPLHRFLSRIGGDEARDARLPMPAHLAAPGALRRHRGSLAVVALYALLVLVPGLVISALDGRLADRDFVRLTDWRELPGALFLYLLLAPVLWTFYLWQPRLILDVFAGLAEGGVVGAPREAGVTPDR